MTPSAASTVHDAAAPTTHITVQVIVLTFGCGIRPPIGSFIEFIGVTRRIDGAILAKPRACDAAVFRYRGAACLVKISLHREVKMARSTTAAKSKAKASAAKKSK